MRKRQMLRRGAVLDAGSTVLRDVSLSLAELIRKSVHVQTPGDVDVEIKSPGDDDALGQGVRPQVLLYLYRTTENPELRNQPPLLVKTASGFARVPAPAMLDLFYMVVAVAQRAETELLLTNQIKRLFRDTGVLSADQLLGNLIATGNTSLDLVTEDLSLDQMHLVWSTFPSKQYRLSLFYSVGPVAIPSARSEAIDRVLEVVTTHSIK